MNNVKKYQGKKNFEGNQMSKILDNVNTIEEEVPKEYQDFVAVFDSMKEVKDVTYGKN